MQEKIKKGLLVFVFIVLFLPYLQHRFQVVDSGTLQGYFTNAPDVEFTTKGWFDGSYQEGVNNYYNDHIGFRTDLVRLNAQIDYSLFNVADYGGTTIGKDNYLFYTNYIDAYYGRDYQGYEVLHERMRKLKCLQDTLERQGKTVLLVYAACKAWYCSEYIPTLSRVAKKGPNNYLTCLRIGDSLGVKQLDFNAWFMEMKKTTKELLFARQGTHWTNYGSVLVWDSIETYLEHNRYIRMPHPTWTKVDHSTEPWGPDNDMATILNLIYPIAKENFCYPVLEYSKDTTLTKPKCIFIGDSYVINMLKMEVIQHTTTDVEFWFYFRKLLHGDDCNTAYEFPNIAEYDWKSKLPGADCIILVYTPMNTFNIGNGFIEEAYQYYFPGK